MSGVDPNKADIQFINSLSIPGGLISKSAKLVDTKGNEVKTKTVLATLNRLVTNLQSPGSVLTSGTVKQIDAVQSYLTALISARGKAGIIPSKLSPTDLMAKQDQLGRIKDLFAQAVTAHNMEIPEQKGWSYDDGKISRTFNEDGAEITLSRNREGQISVKTKTDDSIESKKVLAGRVLQVNSDMERKKLSNSDFVRFTDPSIQGETVKEKLHSFIGKISDAGRASLIAELYEKLPEDARKGNPVEDLSLFYGMPDGDHNEVAILAGRVRLSSSSTTLLTSFLRLGGVADASAAFRNPDNFTSTLEIRNDRPVIIAVNRDPLDVKTGPRTNSISTHAGTVSAVCDPVSGSIEEEFVITPKREGSVSN